MKDKQRSCTCPLPFTDSLVFSHGRSFSVSKEFDGGKSLSFSREFNGSKKLKTEACEREGRMKTWLSKVSCSTWLNCSFSLASCKSRSKLHRLSLGVRSILPVKLDACRILHVSVTPRSAMGMLHRYIGSLRTFLLLDETSVSYHQ